MAVEVQYRGDNADAGPSDGVWFDVDPLAFPKKQIEIFEDFVTNHNLASGGAPPNQGLVGGVLNLDTDTDTVESYAAFKLAAGKDLTFEARVQQPLTLAAFRLGLESADNSDRISFEVAANSAVLHHDNGTDDDIIATTALPVATWTKLGFRVRGSGDDTEFTAYKDGVKVASKKLSGMDATSVASETMLLKITLLDDPDLYVDWVWVAQLR